jgi:hypothetical protein
MTISLLLLVALFIPSIAAAADERIAFSGAIVEPTCGIAASKNTTVGVIAQRQQTQRLTCATPGNATAKPRAYVLTTRRLSDLESDRVLKYFDTYIKAGRPDAADPMLLTQTYE